MAKLIAITGTHGTGKTTLSFQLAAEYKKLGANVKIIQEVARSCPFPLNDKMTRETALWIYHEHSKKELEACHDHDVVICDRTSFDSFVYAEAIKIDIDEFLKECAKNHLSDYEDIYFVRPDSLCTLKYDGVRSVDKEFHWKLDALFCHYMKELITVQIKASEIFKEDKKWSSYL